MRIQPNMMKARLFFSILMVCFLSVWSSAAIILTVNSQVVDTLALKTGQEALIEIRSNDSASYAAYIGFSDGTDPLGTLTNPEIFTEAGDSAEVHPWSSSPVEGYAVSADGTKPAPSPGLHFRFAYTAGTTVGQTVLKLYQETLSKPILVDSITISVEQSETGTGFTYQGRLLAENMAADDLYDFQFDLYDAPSDGSTVGSVNLLEDVEVEDGYFIVTLDFGNIFGDEARWLQTSVRPGDSTGGYTVLSPRQRITPAPQALYADQAGSASTAAAVEWEDIIGIPEGLSDYVEPQIDTGFVPYYNGTQLVSSPIKTDGQQTGIGSDAGITSAFYVVSTTDTEAITIKNLKNTGNCIGVYSWTSGLTSDNNYALYGYSTNPAGPNYGVYGVTSASEYDCFAVYGNSISAYGNNYGVYGSTVIDSPGNNFAVYGVASNAGAGEAYAGYFDGDVQISGVLNKNHDLQIATDAGAEIAFGTTTTSDKKLRIYTASNTYGLYSENVGTSGDRYGIYGVASGNTTGYSYGLAGVSSSASGYNIGALGQASTPSTGTNYGVYGIAVNTGAGDAYAGYFDGDVRTTGKMTVDGDTQMTGILNRDNDLRIATDDGAEVAMGTSTNSDRKLYVYTDSDGYGLYCENARTSSNNYGVYGFTSGDTGGYNYGVYGTSSSSVGDNYGVYGTATTASDGGNYGVYGYAVNSGAGNAYAGYFNGNVYVTNNVSAQSFTDRTPYPKDLATAYEAVLSMERLPDGQYSESDRQTQLDHSTLSNFIRSSDGNRDLSAAVSCQNEVLKDLIRRTEELEEANAMIERLQGQIVEFQEQNKRLERLEAQLTQLALTQ